MKNKRLIYGILSLISLMGIAVAVYFKLKNKSKPVSSNSVSSGTEENNVIEETQILPTENTATTSINSVVMPKLSEPSRPGFFTSEMQTTLEGLMNWYSTNGDYSAGYADWIKQWPGEKYRVKSPEDYLYETVIQDMIGRDIINITQSLYLRKYYGIGWDILGPKDLNKLKPSWLNLNDWEYHMWWYFNYYYHEQKYGTIKQSFYKALDQMAHDKNISADKIQAAKDYYDTSITI